VKKEFLEMGFGTEGSLVLKHDAKKILSHKEFQVLSIMRM